VSRTGILTPKAQHSYKTPSLNIINHCWDGIPLRGDLPEDKEWHFGDLCDDYFMCLDSIVPRKAGAALHNTQHIQKIHIACKRASMQNHVAQKYSLKWPAGNHSLILICIIENIP
jgi:hypothetical protein